MMSRRYQPNELFVHEDDSGASYVNQTVLVPEGRYLLVPAPDICPGCDGEGQHTPEHDGATGYICPACGGRGYVWPDKLVERVARSWYQTEADTDEWDFCLRISRRMLDALVEVDDE